MPIITNATLSTLNTSFKATFQKQFNGIESQKDKVATTITSSTASNTYGWLGEMPNMREWVGDRVIKDLTSHSYSIANKIFESTIGVKRTDIEDDNLGIYTPMVAELAHNAALHPDQLVFELLKAGDSSLCYDGQNFFDADHPTYANHDGTGAVTTVSNIETGTEPAWYLLDTSRSLKPLIFQQRTKAELQAMTKTDDESVFTSDQFRYGTRARHNVGFGFWQLARQSKAKLTSGNLTKAIAAMMAIKADGGNKLGVRPTTLIVPPALRGQALEIVQAERLANGATNINRNVVEVLVSPWVGD